jgi:hypothetical protein
MRVNNQSFNDPERFLINHWEEARQMELSMVRVRKGYEEIAQRLIDAVKGKHIELDAHASFLTQDSSSGWIGFGRKVWPECSNEGQCVYRVENIRLEYLSDENEPAPLILVWLRSARKNRADMDILRKAVHAGAKAVMSEDEFKACTMIKNDKNSVLSYTIPEGRKRLLEFLTDKDSSRFIECISTHVDIIAKLTPTLDRVLPKNISRP